MRTSFLLIILFPSFLATATGQQKEKPASRAAAPLSGKWVVTGVYLGTPINGSLELAQQAEKLTGSFEGDKLEGSLTGNSIHFLAKDDQGGSEEGTGTVQGDAISGTIKYINSFNPSHPVAVPFTARLVPRHHAGNPQRHEFTPTVFYRQFSSTNEPVLTVAPGDSIHTTTVDAAGTDEKGNPRALGGNPETGPFYVETAAPGDTLVVHLTRVRLNRDWAISDDAVVDRGLDNGLAVKMKDGGKPVRWHLDSQRGVATPEKPA